MSRLIDALRNLQQPEEASETARPRKVTPRLAASIRKAVLGNAGKPVAAEAPVLFRMHSEEPAEAPAPVITTHAPPITAPLPPTPPELVVVATPPAPRVAAMDPVRLVEAIQASISAVQLEQAPDQPLDCTPDLSVPSPQPTPPSRREPTTAELEIRALLADEAQARPYRELLATVQRDVASRLSPVVAIVGLDDQDATAHVAAALGTVLAESQVKTTLLIDGNPARSVTQRYHQAQATGLAESLAGWSKWTAAIAPTSHPQLDLLPFGQATAEQAQRLPQALAAEIGLLRSSFAAAVIDAGPLSSEWALAASQAADAVYLVVRVGDTSAEYATACVQRFRAAGGKLTGCIAVGQLQKNG